MNATTEEKTRSPDVRRLTASLEETVLELINFRDPVPLVDVAAHAHTFDAWGVYLITEGRPQPAVRGEVPSNIIYIGKGVGEGIAGRALKHFANMTSAVNAAGEPKIRTSRAIRAYRDREGHDPSDLWFSPGVMDGVNGSVVGFAEDVLLERYVAAYGRLPVCNIAGGRIWAESPASSYAPTNPTKAPAGSKMRARVVEDDALEELCVTIAAKYGLACEVIPMSGPEPRIALGYQANGNLVGIAIRAMFKPRTGEVAIYSKLQPEAAKGWGSVRGVRQSGAMKSVMTAPWPLDPVKFEALLLASAKEVRTAQSKRR